MNPSTPPSREPQNNARPVRLGRWALAAFVLVAVLWYLGAAPKWKARADTADRARQTDVPYVLVTHPSGTNGPEAATFPAELKAWTEAQILPRASGYIRAWHVDLGARVKAGELLAEIEAPELEQELAKARADLAHAEAATSLAETTSARWQDLLKTAGVSEQETAEKVADLALKKAAGESARASVRRLEQLIGFTRVTAPFDGMVTARRLDVGELVSSGSTRELFHLADTSRIRIFVHLPQSLASTLATHQAAELIPGETATRVIPVHVARTGGQLDAATRTLLVEFDVDNAKGEFIAGSFARVRFPENRPESVLTVPANSLVFHSEGPQVGVVRNDNVVEMRRITLGRDLGPVVEVRAGLAAADRVVMNPSDSLHDGQAVQIRPTAAARKP